MSKKIAIVESSLIIREGLKSVLKNNPNFTVWKDIPQLNENNFEQIVLLADYIIINPLEIGFANIAKQIGQWKEKKRRSASLPSRPTIAHNRHSPASTKSSV